MTKKRKVIEVIEGYVEPHSHITKLDKIYDFPAWSVAFLFLEVVGKNTRKVRITIEEL